MENQIRNLINIEDLLANTDISKNIKSLEKFTTKDIRVFIKVAGRVIKNLSKEGLFFYELVVLFLPIQLHLNY